MAINKKLLTSIACFALMSCATQEAVHNEVKKAQTGPSATPHKSITNFSDGLRCMDNMMIEYGISDISMLVEDLEDQTSKVNAGTKDMLITAVSKMTRRSRAVKLIPFGNDSGNLISFLGAAGANSAYNVVPKYDIRGSISQLDSSVVRKQLGASVAAGKWGAGASQSTAGSILGIDLSVLTTEDLSVLPGVTSSNSVILFKSGKGGDADATIKKTGISFDFQVSKSEATVQALRNLIELASIELIGKLVKVPYWQCVGIPNSSPEIQREIEDWYYAMNAHGELQPFVRSRLIARGLYPMSEPNAGRALSQGIRNYQQASGESVDGKLNYSFFQLLLKGRDVSALKRPDIVFSANIEDAPKIAPKPSSKPTPVMVEQTQPQNLSLNLRTASGSQSFKQGAAISLLASSNTSAYVYCYFVDTDNTVQRFFPNRFQSDNFIPYGNSVTLPGNMPFDITADVSGESITCFATPKNVYHQLPNKIRAYDFETLSVKSVNEVREGFRAASNGSLAEASFQIQVN